jgi:hypothetical protein
MMRGLLVTGVVLVAAFGVLAVGAIGPASRSDARALTRCPSSHARTLVADRNGRLISWKDHGVRSWYGCLRHRRPVELDIAEQGTQVLHSPRIASPYAAYANFTASGLGNSTEVVLVDLRNDREQGGQGGSTCRISRCWAGVRSSTAAAARDLRRRCGL